MIMYKLSGYILFRDGKPWEDYSGEYGKQKHEASIHHNGRQTSCPIELQVVNVNGA